MHSLERALGHIPNRFFVSHRCFNEPPNKTRGPYPDGPLGSWSMSSVTEAAQRSGYIVGEAAQWGVLTCGGRRCGFLRRNLVGRIHQYQPIFESFPQLWSKVCILKALVTYPRHETLWSEDPILIFEETWQKEVNSYLRNERCVAHHCSKRKHQNISTIGIIFEAWLRRGMCIAGCHDMLSLLGSWVGVLYLLTYIILLNINMFVIVCILLYVHAIFLDVFLDAFVQWKWQFQRSKHNLMAWRRKPLLPREAVISGG